MIGLQAKLTRLSGGQFSAVQIFDLEMLFKVYFAYFRVTAGTIEQHK